MNHWLYPANVKYYDVLQAFDAPDVYWPINSKVMVGDVVYFYLAAPHKQVAFVCEVVEVGIEQHLILESIRPFFKGEDARDDKESKPFMKLCVKHRVYIDKTSQLTYEHLKENGLNGMLMGPRKLENNPSLLTYIKGCLQ